MSRYGHIRIDGRNVCRKWLAEHPAAYPEFDRGSLLVSLPKLLKKPTRVRVPYVPALARWFIPENKSVGERAEHRLMDMNYAGDRRIVNTLSDCYAMPGGLPDEPLPTFFPDLA